MCINSIYESYLADEDNKKHDRMASVVVHPASHCANTTAIKLRHSVTVAGFKESVSIPLCDTLYQTTSFWPRSRAQGMLPVSSYYLQPTNDSQADVPMALGDVNRVSLFQQLSPENVMLVFSALLCEQVGGKLL
jgi:hypothetical protein